MSDLVLYEERGRVAVLTLNRPEARNAVNGEVAEAMEAAIDRLEDDDDVWVGVLTHNGPVFSAGADLKAIASGGANALGTKRGGFAGLVQRERTKPLIAAIDGPALAGGCEIMLACDLAVASTASRFGLPEVKRSLVAAAGGLFRLPRMVPRRIALELAITGEPIDAERAYQFGLINRLCEPGSAFDEAMALAEVVNACAPLAVRETRHIMLTATDLPDEEGWQMSFDGIATMAATEDFAEGPRAFIEKRDPVWKAR